MLNDGSTYRLYFFKVGSNTTLYQFGFNAGSNKYEYGFNSIKVLTLSGMPKDADTRSFAMLYDGSDYRLYMKGLTNTTTLYQAAYNIGTQKYEYGFNSADFSILKAPKDTDFSRWAMLHDGTDYRLYMFKQESDTVFYQFSFTGKSYTWGANKSIPTLSVVEMPATSNRNNFTMLHDGADYRFYFQSK